LENLRAQEIDGTGTWKRRALSPLMAEGWLAPEEVRTEGRNLFALYGNHSRNVSPNYREMTEEVLYGLLRLADEEKEEPFIEYAKKWGMLGLCKHGLPVGHRLMPRRLLAPGAPVSAALEPGIAFDGCSVRRKGDWIVEPLSQWRYYARQVKSIVSLAIVLRGAKPFSDPEFEGFIKRHPLGTRTDPSITKVPNADGTITFQISERIPGEIDDWRVALEDMGTVILDNADPVNLGRVLISRIVNHWLTITAIRPICWWAAQTSRFNLQSTVSWNGVLPVVAVRLMLMLSDSPDYAICPKCKSPFYLRAGQTSSDMRKNYCADCGLKAARHEANKRYYKAERERPRRKKRKRLTAKQREAVVRALRKSRPGLVKQLAKKYGVSVWAIYKIGNAVRKE
jgi:uncharacterized Zn finger protein (UPF0148 family)